MLAETLPDVRRGHALAYDVREIGGHVKKAASPDGGIVDQGDVTNRGSNACAKNAEAGETLLFEPAEAAAGGANRMALVLKRKNQVVGSDVVVRILAPSRGGGVVSGGVLLSG